MASRSYLSTATSIKLRFSNLGSSLFPTAGSATPVLRAVHKSLNPDTCFTSHTTANRARIM
ncbi:hypothetical protein FOFC_11204 [Fusarium oxysporum]|nr:hypothetical protein FOFC_11204 [Fusarium oxysporum]